MSYPIVAIALLSVLLITPDLPAQHTIDTGRGLAMAPPLMEFGFNDPFNHLGVQIQGGLTRLNDYEYSVGPSYATVVEDHLVPLSLTATATYYTELARMRIGIGVGFQRTALRTVVDYAGVPVRRPEGDTMLMEVAFEARNVAESIVLDLMFDAISFEVGPGDLYLRTGLRSRATLSRERTETVRLPGDATAHNIELGDTIPQIDNGAGAIVAFVEDDDFRADVAVNLGLGWRIGFPRSNEVNEFSFSDSEQSYGPILIIPTIDFYFPILGSRPIEQASWEVMVGVGFVVPL